MQRPAFVPGAELSGAFYREAVRPLLDGRSHAAALLGWGSDVLGYDTARSTDHGWGPRLLILLGQGTDPAQAAALSAELDERLPESFHGWPVRFGWDNTPVRHHVAVDTAAGWSLAHLGVDATAGMSTTDWLLTPQQRLLGVVAGVVYADDRGELERLRQVLDWYPDAVWRWLVACQWERLAQEEAFVARTAEVGDEIGSATTAARLVRDAMRLALLLERRYAPYQKWLGTAFARLPHSDGLPACIEAAVHAGDAAAREAALAAAYQRLGERHNRTGLTAPLDPMPRTYYDRPARVLRADRFAAACFDTVNDDALRRLPPIGSVDQVVDSVDVLSSPGRYRRLIALYDGSPI
ncbi:MAG: DUF4037 domain-containing protein [bacterium]